MVETLTAYGIPQDAIARLVPNPDTGEPISERTLQTHFKNEIAIGKAKADAKVIGALFKNATTGTQLYPGGHPTSQIFWVKARCGWRTRDYDEGDGEGALPPPAVPEERDRLEVARRVWHLLRQAERAKRPKAIAG